MNRRPQYLFPDGAQIGASNVVLHARAKQHRVANYAGPLSIKTVLCGRVAWGRRGSTRRRSIELPRASDGEQYSMDIAATKPVETCCVFFERGFVEQVALDLTSPLKQALDNPERVGQPLPYLSALHSDRKRALTTPIHSLAPRCRQALTPSAWEQDFLLLAEALVASTNKSAARPPVSHQSVHPRAMSCSADCCAGAITCMPTHPAGYRLLMRPGRPVCRRFISTGDSRARSESRPTRTSPLCGWGRPGSGWKPAQPCSMHVSRRVFRSLRIQPAFPNPVRRTPVCNTSQIRKIEQDAGSINGHNAGMTTFFLLAAVAGTVLAQTLPPLHVSMISIGVTDMDRSIRFYTETLGLAITGPRGEVTMIRAGAITIALNRPLGRSVKAAMPGAVEIIFSVESVSATETQLKGRGCTFISSAHKGHPGTVGFHLLRSRRTQADTAGWPLNLRESFFDDFATHNRRALRPSVVKEGDAHMIQPERLQDGSVDVVTCARFSMPRSPISSVVPMTWPGFTPPPAIQMVKPHGL